MSLFQVQEVKKILKNLSQIDLEQILAITDVNPKTQSIIVEQKLFQGFAGVAGMQKSKIGLSLADAKLLKSRTRYFI